MDGECNTYGESVLVEKPDGKTPIGKPRRRCNMILIKIFKRWDEKYGMYWSPSE
jgi:hypothetical protein